MKNKFIALMMALALGITSLSIPSFKTKAATSVATYTLLTGTTVHVLPQYTAATGTTYTYSSGNSSIASVDAQGNVTGVTAGTTTILVKRTINSSSAAVTPSPLLEASSSIRDTNMTSSSFDESTNTSTLADWNAPTITPTQTPIQTPTQMPTENYNYIEGLSDATPIPTIKPTSITPTSVKSSENMLETSPKTSATKTTSVSSYAMYTVNVIPLTINATKTSIGVGDTLKLTTNLASNVQWSCSYTDSDNTKESLEEKEGNKYEFTPSKEGTYIITASYTNGQDIVSSSIDIEVLAKSEKQIEMEKNNAKKVEKYIKKNGFKFKDYASNIAKGDSILFSTNLDQLTYASVTWSSSNTKVAKVTATGLVKGLSEGVTKITAEIAGKKITKKVVVEPTSTFKLTKTTDEIAVGDSFTFKTNKNENVEWSCDNENVLLVKDGKVTGKSIGSATLTIKYNETTLKKTVNVTGDSTMLHVTSGTNMVNVNEKIAIETNRDNCVYSIDNTNIAYVEPATGILTGKSRGTAILTITRGSEKILYTINVVDGSSDLAFVSLKDSYATGVNSIIQTNKSNSSFISSNTAVATIDRTTGELRTLTEGVTVIYAFSGTEQVSKQIKVTSLGKGETLKSMVVGDTATLISNEENVTWSSSNQNVVAINSLTGELKAVGSGTCMIYMYSDSKITFTEVSVREAVYTVEQQKAISNANRYIQTLLSEDGESLKLISTENSDTILSYLKECRRYLDLCEELGVDITTLKYYDLYDAGVNQYLLTAKGYTNGTLITLEEGKGAALEAINQAILKATASTSDVELKVAISNIIDLIENAKETYLIANSDISMYDVLTELIQTLEDDTSTSTTTTK